MQIDPFLSPCTKLKSKWIKDLHVKPDTLNLIEEKVGKILNTWAQGAYALRSRINKWYLIKLQSSCNAKNNINRTKWQSTDWEKIFSNPTSITREGEWDRVFPVARPGKGITFEM
jgi:hypothetical protein